VSTIKRKLAKGGLWVTLQRVSAIAFKFVKITILTHYLSPAEFGIFGIALITFNLISSLSQTGFNQALIQKKGDISHFLNSAWTFRIIRSFITAALLFLLAPLAGKFFNSADSIPVIRAISVIFVVGAFVNIADVYLKKNLDFRTNFFYLFGGEVLEVILSIVFVIILRNIWALYIGMMGGLVFRCILSYIIFKYRPKLELDVDKVKELFRFGKWILAGSVVAVFAGYFDNVMVGRLIGVAALGIYQAAYNFSRTGSGELANVLSQIYFPYFSAIQDNKQEMEKSYLNLLKLSIIIMVYITMGMICLAPGFTILFLDSKWHSIIGIIQILSIASLFHAVVRSASPFLRGKGKPKYFLFIQTIKVVTLVIFVFILTEPYGIKGVAYSVVIAESVALVYWFFIIRQIIPSFVRKLFHIAAAPAIISVVMGIVIALFWIIPGKKNVDLSYLEFFISGTLGTIVFAGMLYFYMKIDPSYSQGYNVKKIVERFTG